MNTRSDPLQTVQQLVAARREMPGALLPVLHAIQDALGYIPGEAVPEIAQQLNLSRAEVHGVITFYKHFRQQPPGQHTLQICRAEACQSMGGAQLWRHACRRLQLPEGSDADDGHGGTSADGRFTLEPVYCLGLCSSSPALMLNDQPHARVDAARLDRLLAAADSTPNGSAA